MNNLEQTKKSFLDKWNENKALAFSETLREGSDIFNWILERNGIASPSELSIWLRHKNRILDAGCGNGRVTALLRRYAPKTTSIVGIDISSSQVASENLKHFENVEIYEKDLLSNIEDLGFFDLIYCQEVLHHTSDPKRAFLNLCQRLSNNGEIAVYVYKVKAPMREYADDLIRKQVSLLSYEQAMSNMAEITKLGRALSEMGLKINVPDVKVLGIEGGEYDLQRFFYHFFLKCFWNPNLSESENVAINYDWYHPQICTRHTIDEIESWFLEANLSVIHRCVDYYGITIRGIRNG